MLAAYGRGERTFRAVTIEDADFRGDDLAGASFYGPSLRRANFDDANLIGVRLFDADLTAASFGGADLYRAQLDHVALPGARLRASLEEARLEFCDLTGADLTHCELDGASLDRVAITDATVDRVILGRTTFSDIDLSPFSEATGLQHISPSHIDFRSVMRSYRHPGLKRFLVDCGVPPLVAEYTIAAAEAEGDALQSLMRSTFISYGGPDEPFARKLYEELRAHGVTTFFFPESARLGRRIGDEVHSRIQEHDRVILVCSEESLDRPGVRNEIQETFDREARDGGATYLIPITIDDYVFNGWNDPLAERVRDRVVGDFHGGRTDPQAFDKAMSRLLAALRKEPT